MIPDLVDADVIIHIIWIIAGVIKVIARSIILASAILQDIGRIVVNIAVIHMTTLSIPMRYVRDVRANAVMYVFLIALLRWLALVNFCASSSNLASEQAYNKYKEYKDALQYFS